MPNGEPPHGYALRLAIVLGVAAVLRGAVLLQTLSDPLLRDLLILDSRIYSEFAERIAGGDLRAGSEVFALGPLYMYFLAALRVGWVEGTAPVYAVQWLLGLGSIACVASIARRCFDERAALVAAASFALYGAMAVLEVKVMASTLAVFLGLLGLRGLLAARDGGGRGWALAAGLALGLACLARPNTLLFVPVAALWLAWDAGLRLQRARLGASLAFALGVCAAVAPVTARNYTVSGERVLISSQGGITFYQANNERARGLYTRLPGFVGSPTRMREQARDRAEEELGRSLSESEVSAYWTRRGLRFLADQPLQGVALIGRKLWLWVSSTEHSTEYVPAVERAFTPALWAFPVPFGLLLGLSALGARRAGWRDPAAALLLSFVAVNLLSVLVFYFSSRYRLPAVPAVAVFAGGGLAALIDKWNAERRSFWIWSASCLAIAAVSLAPWGGHLDSQSAQQHYNYGQVYLRRGEFEAAIERYTRAIALFEGRWQPHLGLASALEQSGRRVAALRAYERVLALHPQHRVAQRRAARLRQHGIR